MSLQGLLPEVSPADRSLVLINGSAPEPVKKLLGEVFREQPVAVEVADRSEWDDDTVILVEDGVVIASSPLDALQEAILIVNSDLFVTGARDLEAVDVPAVIQGLEGIPFQLRGYPESNSEKLLLILVSRFVERKAHQAGSGTLRASFQLLSRLKDEMGTRAVYEKLADTDLDVHVYGQPDWIPSTELDVITHAGTDENFERGWFVLFEPDETGSAIGILAYETEPREWDGFYTADPNRVAAIADHVKRKM